ncbi:hypothetical protein FDP41_002259 [Naegleria fowleri]|uniref:Uncharacterized protein n=1 Tax=Naegleria fowleri TaxID=5763 RepID=A0A6A5BZM4_NAEFO|nr:uncharacterized protein FDP41_002259 [Naegleria fowleri]KAF0978439.1 hypothetical protein FDP41_002259 [Naegleria fowleri]CAG4715088.1 unnamed protein product [Naegleria fowleri]
MNTTTTAYGMPIPSGSGFALSPIPNPLVDQYISIEDSMNQLSVFVPQYHSQTLVVHSLQEQVNQQRQVLQSVSSQVLKEKKSVEKLYQPSISNFFSKALDKHGFEKKIEKEQLEYKALLEKEHQAKYQLEQLEAQLMQAQSIQTSLHQHVQSYETKKRELESCIDRMMIAANLPPHHIIPQTQQELFMNQNKKQQIVCYLSQYKAGLTNLQQAYSLLQSCYQRLSEAKNLATADLFMNGGIANMYVDSMKYENLNRANDDAKKAKMFIAEAVRQCPPLASQPLFVAKVTQGDFVFDVFFDNIIADYIVREKIRKSKEAMSESIQQLTITLNWLQMTCIPQIERDLQEVDQLIASLSTTLQQERMAIVMQALHQKSSQQSQLPVISLGVPNCPSQVTPTLVDFSTHQPSSDLAASVLRLETTWEPAVL